MIKNQTVLESSRNSRQYQISCSPDSPLGELYDVLNEFRAFIIGKMVEEQNNSSGKEKDD